MHDEDLMKHYGVQHAVGVTGLSRLVDLVSATSPSLSTFRLKTGLVR